MRLLIFTLALTTVAFGQRPGRSSPGATATPRLDHALAGAAGQARTSPRAGGFPVTVRVLAVMVQFQQDNDQAKDGNGQFVLAAPGSPYLDAPPHDSAYFAGHLEFLANYFRRVSKGRTLITWTLPGTVYTLPGVMYDYSPRGGEGNQRLANLARDTWHAVDSSGRVPTIASFDCYVLFHAGVGHDVDLVSSLGYDPAPHDIPSIYLGPVAFRSLLGGGIAVGGGQITNTIIMPETETRNVPALGGTAQLTLGMNGLMCASLGSYLGLPDLFDTQSGASAIGRFGLMDGQSIFSWSGAFPPEPSAWEKYWLGWVNPLRVPSGVSTLALPAVALADSIYRVPISDGEYYLVENRSRDPLRTGVTVTTALQGAVRTIHHARDTAGFAYNDITALVGTITDVDVPDWSLPGGVGDDGTFFDGGTLLWHIDEGVINANIGTNTVNADSSRRGVNLEEADGSQDIGHTYDITSGGLGSEDGTALDFWFSGNSSPVNKNAFSATTFPNSNSNQGALSHVAIDNFSVRSPRMTARVTRGDAISPVQGYPKQVGESLQWTLSVAVAGSPAKPSLVVGTTGQAFSRKSTQGEIHPLPGQAKLYLLPPDSTGHIAPFRNSGVIGLSGGFSGVFNSAAGVADLNGDGADDIVTTGSQNLSSGASGFVRAYTLRSATTDSLAQNLFERQLFTDPLATPVIADSLIAVCGSHAVYFLRFDGSIADSIAAPDPLSTPGPVSRWAGPNSFVVLSSDGTVRLTVRDASGKPARQDVTRKFGTAGLRNPAVTGFFGPDAAHGRVLTAFVTPEGSLYLVDSTLTPVAGFPVSIGGQGGPILADLDGDGIRDIVVGEGGRLLAYNITGATLDHFPVDLAGGALVESVVAGDVDGDGRIEIVA
ncbi:MAG TPA: FG-GAP-like repeat-containing protein, partial [Bacteroidota bacterium]|nr:FG-GAP-like repeat-containing protein [Bacteroidota bacterium]